MKVIALLALLPMTFGSPPEEQHSLAIGLCSGGEIVIPVDDEEPGRDGGGKHNACHAAGACRGESRRSSKRI